jgi:DNA-binding MarR family transcriptional regulator
MYDLKFVLEVLASQKTLLLTDSRLEVLLLLELYRVNPSPLMLKSLAAVCDINYTVASSHIMNLSRRNMVEVVEGVDKRAKYFLLTPNGASRVRNFLRTIPKELVSSAP